MSLKSTLLRTFAKVGLLFGVIFLFFWMFLYTPLGVRWTIGAVNTLTPWHIHYNDAEGHLAGPFAFEGFTLESSEFKLSIQDIQIEWGLWSLATGTFSLESVIASDIVYTPKQESISEPEPISIEDIKHQLSHGPIHFKIHNFSAKNILLNTHDTPLRIDNLSFTKVDSRKQSIVKTMVLEGGFGHFSVLAEKDLNISFDLAIADLSQWSQQLSGDFRGHGVMVVADLNQPIETTDFSISFESKRLTINENTLDRLSFNANGSLTNATASIEGIINQHDVRVGFKTQYDAPQWRVNILPSHWRHPKYGLMPKIDGFITLNQLDVMQGKLAINLLQKNQLRGEYQIDKLNQYTLSGALHGSFQDFSIVNRFFPQIGPTSGRANLDIDLSGTLLKPVVRGNAKFSAVHVPLADMGTELYVDTLTLSNPQQGILNLQGSGKLGEGTFQLTGSTDFNGEQPDVRLKLIGKQLVLSRTPEYFIVANPDITFIQHKGRNRIEGDLRVTEADIHMDKVDNYVAASSDIVIVQDKQAKRPIEQPNRLGCLDTNLTITLTDKVHFKGYNLRSNVHGKLNVKGQSGEPMIATGKVYLKNGQYKARGKTLTITHGKLTWASSPLSNPAIDVKGQREVQPINPSTDSSDIFKQQMIHHGPMVVGVTLTGTLKAPLLRLFSQPTMNEGDVLSYLLLDKPQASASITEGKLLYEAANELIFHFGSKTSDLRPSLVERFNLDRFELSSKPKPGQNPGIEDTVLIIGKQFSSRLYAEYTLGILDSASAVHLRYLVGKHITFETSATKNQVSADLLFIFENG